MFERKLGRSGIPVSALGMGCWAIGGPWWRVDEGDPIPAGWGQIDDAESIRAIHAAMAMGVTFFDTADVYGCGHSERILGEALAGRRDRVVIATKVGSRFDEATKTYYGHAISPESLRCACEDSLRRLGADTIDLYQLHWSDFDGDAVAIREAFEGLVSEGKIRAYGWSTNDPARARVFAEGAHCTAVQHTFSVVSDAPEMLALCEEANLASIARSPLAMGILTGKFDAATTFSEDDVRSGWDLREGSQAERLRMVEAIRDVLTSSGRTLAQGALAWLWARSDRAIPIPGFKTVRQVEENAAAMALGPLSGEQMRQIDTLLGRTHEGNP
jgi:aryl-alcohol dehydrogenase-like predicted oxidoreductase